MVTAVVVKEEHLLSVVNMEIENEEDVEFKYDNSDGVKWFNMNFAFN